MISHPGRRPSSTYLAKWEVTRPRRASSKPESLASISCFRSAIRPPSCSSIGGPRLGAPRSIDPVALPERGWSKAEVIDALTAKKASDVHWQDGRTFGLVFDGGPEVHKVAREAALMFLDDNALNTRAFPSLGEIQSEVVGACADLFHGDEASGFMTSGGTESILMAVKA